MVMWHSIQAKLGLVFLVFLILVAGSVVATSRALEHQRIDMLAVGAAVEQRELIHTVSRHVFRIQAGRQRGEHNLGLIELDEAAGQFDIMLETMLSGGMLPVGGQGRVVQIPAVADSTVRAQLQLVRERWVPIAAAVEVLLTNPSLLEYSRAVTEIQTKTTYLTRELDTLVVMLESDSRRHLALLTSIQVIFFLTALALLGGGYTLVDYFIIRPLRSLDAAALQLADGNLDKPVPGQHQGEIGELARSFETMRRKVASSRSAAEAWTRELESRVEQRTRELRSLLDISADISSQLDVDRVLESVVNKCRELLNADLSVLCLIHSERQKLYVASASGPKTAIVPQHIPVGEGPTRCVVGNEHTLTCTGRETCGMISPEYSGMQIVAPLRAGKQVLGALCVSHHQENGLADDASHLLTLLANSAAIAVSNAQLFSQAENAAALSERESIATEMHDGLAQMLGYINLQVDQALAKADGRRSKPVREHLLDIQPAVQSAYDTARRMMIGLIEDDISQQSFRAQLEAQMAEFRHQTGLPAALRLRGEYAPDLAKQTKQQLLRIFQESLVNVRRHASASRVEIIMETGPESVAISVGDDGCGFDPAAIVGNGRHHLGLKIMRGRAERVGGKLRVKSKPGEGTTVTAEVPLTPERGQ